MSARKLAASSVANIGLHTNKAASSLLSLLPMVVVLTVLFFLLLPLLMVLVDALWWSSDQRSHGINLYLRADFLDLYQVLYQLSALPN